MFDYIYSYICITVIQQFEGRFIEINQKVSKVDDFSRGWPEGSLFNSYYNEV